MADDAEVIKITVDGKSYEIDPAGLTGSETKDFRAAVGVGPAQAVVAGDFDLDVIAGFVWLTRRREVKALTYRAVADAITWRNVVFETDKAAEPAEDPAGPEA